MTRSGVPRHHFLAHGLSALLRRRRTLKHFGRHPLLDPLAGRGPAQAGPEHMALDPLRVARDEPAEAIARLKSHPDGVSAREAAARLARSGSNEVEHQKPLSWWLHLWHSYKNPFNLLLTVLAVVSFLSADAKATIVIGFMVVLSTVIRFVQKDRACQVPAVSRPHWRTVQAFLRASVGVSELAIDASELVAG